MCRVKCVITSPTPVTKQFDDVILTIRCFFGYEQTNKRISGYHNKRNTELVTEFVPYLTGESVSFIAFRIYIKM